LLVGGDHVPLRRPEIPMSAGVLARAEGVREDVGSREVGDGVPPGLVQEHNVFAVGDPLAAKANPHTSAKRFGEQQALG
jgi:hypothetical protein